MIILMKKYLYTAIIGAMVALSFTSCDEETSAGLTSITYYPVIELTGGDVAIALGENYVEPGAVATLNGEDVSDQMEVTNDIDNSQVGLYHVNYSAVNSDGFSASESRNVYVINEGSIATIYRSECQYGSRHYYDLPIQIYDNGDGTYEVEDILGGFYCMGRYPGYEAYGYDFWCEGTIKVEGSQATLLSTGNWFWASTPVVQKDGTYDAATGTFTFNFDFSGSNFYVQLVAVKK